MMGNAMLGRQLFVMARRGRCNGDRFRSVTFLQRFSVNRRDKLRPDDANFYFVVHVRIHEIRVVQSNSQSSAPMRNDVRNIPLLVLDLVFLAAPRSEGIFNRRDNVVDQNTVGVDLLRCGTKTDVVNSVQCSIS